MNRSQTAAGLDMESWKWLPQPGVVALVALAALLTAMLAAHVELAVKHARWSGVMVGPVLGLCFVFWMAPSARAHAPSPLANRLLAVLIGTPIVVRSLFLIGHTLARLSGGL